MSVIGRRLCTPEKNRERAYDFPVGGYVRAIRTPLRTISPVSSDQALSETTRIPVTALDRKVETVHVLLQLRANGYRSRHRAEGKGMRPAPRRRFPVLNESIVR